MTKRFKKGLGIFGAIVAILIVILIAVPFLFKDKIKQVVLDIANEQINARVEIGDFGLNLFSSFPNATLSLKNVLVIGVDAFEKDTLLQAKSASVTIDLFSLFGSNYDISRINLDGVSVYAKLLADGKANWDIMKESSSTTQADEDSSPFNLSLKRITIKDCNIVYDDLQSKMKAVISRWNGTISGDFSASETTLKTNSTIDELTFSMDGIPYLSKAKLSADAALKANFDNMTFVFENSRLGLNELKAFIEGSFAMVGEEGMDFDLKLNAPDTQFKDILSLVPAMYTDDFKNVKTSGTASLDGYLKGRMEGESYPAFDFKINVDNAMFQYPSLPKSVDNINVNVLVNSKGGSLDNTVVDVSKFSFSLGGNPFAGSVRVTTPMSDPNLRFAANGTLDLGMIKDVYPLEQGTELNGKIVADMSVATAMSSIEKEQYEKVSASGTLKVNDMVYKSPDMADVKINDAGLTFTPQYVNLTSLNVHIGQNDLSATGRLENFIGYLLKDQTIKGNLTLRSNYFNANDFLSEETAEVEADTTSFSLRDIIIPKNIDFVLDAGLKQVVYSSINITDMEGAMTVRDGILTLNNVSAKALGGSCKVTGSYNTSNPEDPKVNFALNLQQVSFAETFKSVESIQKFAPIFESLIGTYSMNFNFNTTLGETILQTLANLAGGGALQTQEVKVENVTALTALSSALKTDALNNFSAKDLNLPFTINNGKIDTKPFNINIGSGGSLRLEGSTGLDQTIEYKGTVTLPKSLANDYINNVPITIGGTFTSPKIGIDAKSLATSAISSAVSGFLDSKREEGEEPVDLSAEKAKQIERLRTEADNAATKLVEEAKKQAAALEEKANGAIAKAAAKVAGNKLVEEAEKQGQKLREQAEEQISKIE
ncbi:AsmA family protein [Parabacteroides sp. OttesenSCG-928-G21]|nr:AsmA family protein [Parabacteroides sp. OttesenSCG-928-G21]